ncbi:hypothetical protein AVEN_236930-1 [Araneus ventricosus]|uniref:Uncharacterized protein n=1 Tax=Araneus ventricosus TaxID=182803 RepID=A0A4Y2WU42_ARAVE|nr:hypothetical protein AVEN_236930-1 [Araneus ventricosus]
MTPRVLPFVSQTSYFKRLITSVRCCPFRIEVFTCCSQLTMLTSYEKEMKLLRKLLAEIEADKESDFDNGPEDIVAQNRPMGAWCKQSNTQVNGELKFIHKYAGKHVVQVTGTIDLAHISNANR